MNSRPASAVATGPGARRHCPTDGAARVIAVTCATARLAVPKATEQADQLVAGRHCLAGEDAALGLRDDAFDQRQVMPDFAAPDPGFDGGPCGQAPASVLEGGHGGAGRRDQIPVELCLLGFAAAVLDGKGALLGEPAVIAPDDRGAPGSALAWRSRRTITRTASHSSELSVGACISARVTVLSMRTILALSSLPCRALLTTARLTASRLAGLMALMVLCSTDFLGVHPRRRLPQEARPHDRGHGQEPLGVPQAAPRAAGQRPETTPNLPDGRRAPRSSAAGIA